ncbi:hypothetical protein RJC27_04245 [Staphylococcus epidermidis]|nr:hypothetical protein [Staphylococcus epidermidis]MDS3939792.1 hypothetical protein [Staphylococcus epidermidis]
MIDINKPEHFDELNEDKKCALMEFCNSLDKIKSFNMRHSSYGLKHVFEAEYSKKLEGTFEGSYITNGQFKGAMLKAGFDVKDKTQLNWHFNLSERSIKDLGDSEVYKRIKGARLR